MTRLNQSRVASVEPIFSVAAQRAYFYSKLEYHICQCENPAGIEVQISEEENPKS